jgi:hypothetical protein
MNERDVEGRGCDLIEDIVPVFENTHEILRSRQPCSGQETNQVPSEYKSYALSFTVYTTFIHALYQL